MASNEWIQRYLTSLFVSQRIALLFFCFCLGSRLGIKSNLSSLCTCKQHTTQIKNTTTMSDDEAVEGTPGYKISKKVDMGTIMQMDAEDESLRKYKEALLGKAMAGDVARTCPEFVILC